MRNLLAKVYSQLLSLNFYTAVSTDEQEIRTGIIATRIAIVLLIGSLVSLTLYSGLVSVTLTITVAQPTFDKYQSLVKQYPDLKCVCSNIAIMYSSFIKFQPRYHQVNLAKTTCFCILSVFMHWNLPTRIDSLTTMSVLINCIDNIFWRFLVCERQRILPYWDVCDFRKHLLKHFLVTEHFQNTLRSFRDQKSKLQMLKSQLSRSIKIKHWTPTTLNPDASSIVQLKEWKNSILTLRSV